jgi:hypothetical protein
MITHDLLPVVGAYLPRNRASSSSSASTILGSVSLGEYAESVSVVSQRLQARAEYASNEIGSNLQENY